MMNDPVGAALCDGHVQRREHQLGAQMRRHRPSHHPAAEHIEHDRQEHESRPSGNVGDVGYPKPIRRVGVELTFDPVRRSTTG